VEKTEDNDRRRMRVGLQIMVTLCGAQILGGALTDWNLSQKGKLVCTSLFLFGKQSVTTQLGRTASAGCR
jgi:hypothetical protein